MSETVMYKKVLMPITVSFGSFCWGYKRLCPHFDNEGGHPICKLGLGTLKYDRETNVEKPQKCKDL